MIYFGTRDYNLINKCNFFFFLDSLNTTCYKKNLLVVLSVKYTRKFALLSVSLRAWQNRQWVWHQGYQGAYPGRLFVAALRNSSF